MGKNTESDTELDACYYPNYYKIMNPEPDPCYNPNICRYTKWETTLSQILNREPDPCFNPKKYKFRNSAESYAEP